MWKISITIISPTIYVLINLLNKDNPKIVLVANVSDIFDEYHWTHFSAMEVNKEIAQDLPRVGIPHTELVVKNVNDVESHHEIAGTCSQNLAKQCSINQFHEIIWYWRYDTGS